MAEPQPPYLASSISYREPMRMLEWLEQAFGFERVMLIVDADGNLAHSEMRFGSSLIYVGSEWSDDHRSPASLGGKNTQSLHVQVTEDIDAHCERARAAGADVFAEPSDQFYGDRTYRARDPEGHIWTVGQRVRTLTPEQWDANAPGLKTTMYA